MHISGLTSSQVWLSSSRSLTNFGSGALAPFSTLTTSVAGAASVDLRPSSGILNQSTITVITGAGSTAAMVIDSWDGTNNMTAILSAVAPFSPAIGNFTQTNSVGARVRNLDATHAGTYMASGMNWTI